VSARAAIRTFTLACVYSALWTQAAKTQTQPQARELWEKMLAAKGVSRSPVRTFVLSSRAVSGSARYNRGAGRERRTIVASLPNGWWIFNDYRPGKLGASIGVYDLGSDKGWLEFANATNPSPQATDPNTPGLQQDRERILAIFFCQAPGFAPIPFEAQRVRRGLNTYDVVRVRSTDELVYYLDPSTHLPSMVEIIVRGTSTRPATPERPAKTISYSSVTPILMKDYHEVSGIRIPARVKLWDSWEDDQIELNVNVSPDLFRKPPAGIINADDWKKLVATRPASP
jgi:hypothetical protein